MTEYSCFRRKYQTFSGPFMRRSSIVFLSFCKMDEESGYEGSKLKQIIFQIEHVIGCFFNYSKEIIPMFEKISHPYRA